jgi:HAMP domain-containing protein
MAEKTAVDVTDAPRVAFMSLLAAEDGLPNTPTGSVASAAAQISSAASLLVVAQLLERGLNELHELVVELHRLRLTHGEFTDKMTLELDALARRRR